MDTRRALLVDAFTTEPTSGNPAGVVPDADGLSGEAMQAIARELNASETAFLLPSGDADRRIRYFTPEREVGLCGHATVAAHAFLAGEDRIDEGDHTLETNVGVLDVAVTDGTVWMTQNPPEIREVDLEYAAVADALGVREAALTGIRADLPLARASTGLPFLMVPVEYLSDLSEMDPDMDAVRDLSEAYDSTGLFAFTFDTLASDSTLHARMFAPAAGVPEDPVTGTAAGACGAYLDRFGAFDPRAARSASTGARDATEGSVSNSGAGSGTIHEADDPGGTPEEMVFEQGHFLDRPGHARVRASAATTEGRVQVGGDAVVALDGELRVPEFDDDEIIEA